MIRTGLLARSCTGGSVGEIGAVNLEKCLGEKTNVW